MLILQIVFRSTDIYITMSEILLSDIHFWEVNYVLLLFYTFYFFIGMLKGISRICLQWVLYYSESFVLKTQLDYSWIVMFMGKVLLKCGLFLYSVFPKGHYPEEINDNGEEESYERRSSIWTYYVYVISISLLMLQPFRKPLKTERGLLWHSNNWCPFIFIFNIPKF